jgi:hypothetical protein
MQILFESDNKTLDVRLKRRTEQRKDSDKGEIKDWKRKEANRSDRERTRPAVWCLKSEVQCLVCREILIPLGTEKAGQTGLSMVLHPAEFTKNLEKKSLRLHKKPSFI